MKQGFEIIEACEVDEIRTGAGKKPEATWIDPVHVGLSSTLQFGVIERIIGTGRATCRSCGKKIAKGDNALRFAWDFSGCGAWTVLDVQIHEAACEPVVR